MYNHDPSNNNCPRNADPRNESCACLAKPLSNSLSPEEERIEALEQVVRKYRNGNHHGYQNSSGISDEHCPVCVKADALLGTEPSAPRTPKDEIKTLVNQFSRALEDKLNRSEAKYGWNNGWMKMDWRHDLLRDLRLHVEKGDPLDVAAYCAFAWHHGWPLAAPKVDSKEEQAMTGEECVFIDSMRGKWCRTHDCLKGECNPKVEEQDGELPPLNVTKDDFQRGRSIVLSRNGGTNWKFADENDLADLSCRERQLLAALHENRLLKAKVVDSEPK